MSGQAIALATKGRICKPQEIIRNFVIPINMSIKTNKNKINIMRSGKFKINLNIHKENIHIVNNNVGLTIKTIKPSITLKACN